MGSRSSELWQKALVSIPGGVNSPVRAFKSVGGNPRFVAAGHGSTIYDVDGKSYIDYVMSWGPLILGHAPSEVIAILQTTLLKGTSFGIPTEAEVLLAEEVIRAVPSAEKVRLVNSGTEATMSALRLARGFTGRDKIAKFEGCYHGHADGLLVKAGSGALTFGAPDSAGVPAAVAEQTLVLPYNHLEETRSLLLAHRREVAAVIVEPVAGNMGCVRPAPGFLEGLRKICLEIGALLIFDEIITGFRVAYGGMQSVAGITPDLTCLGKILGGGLPMGAYAGRAEIMDLLAPEGPVYQAGTLSGNPLAVNAGWAMLKVLSKPGTYERLESLGHRLEQGLRESLTRARVPGQVNRMGSLLTLFFTDHPVTDLSSAMMSDTKRYAEFHSRMLEAGITLPPSQFECWFLSLAHTEDDIDKTVAAAAASLDLMRPA